MHISQVSITVIAHSNVENFVTLRRKKESQSLNEKVLFFTEFVP